MTEHLRLTLPLQADQTIEIPAIASRTLRVDVADGPITLRARIRPDQPREVWDITMHKVGTPAPTSRPPGTELIGLIARGRHEYTVLARYVGLAQCPATVTTVTNRRRLRCQQRAGHAGLHDFGWW